MTIVMGKPTFPPYVCIDCGMQSERQWFVDLQLNLDLHFNPVLNGAVYLCNECFDSRVLDTMRQVQLFVGVSYEGEAPTYNNKAPLLEELPVGEKNDDDGEQNIRGSTGTSDSSDDGTGIFDSSSTGIDFGTTSVDLANAGDQSESSTDSDDDDKSLSEFRAHFGNV